MHISPSNHPEAYRLGYDLVQQRLFLLVSPEIQKRLSVFENNLRSHKPSVRTVGPFMSEQFTWGYGGCMQIHEQSNQWGKWSFSATCGDSTIEYARFSNTLSTLERLLRLLNAISEAPETLLSTNQSQRAFLQTIIRYDGVNGCPMWGSLSSESRLRLTSLFRIPKRRRDMLRSIFHVMDQTYRANERTRPDVKLFDDEPSLRTMMLDDNRASDGYVSVHFFSSWRIGFDCLGASLAITPEAEVESEAQGVELQPHNTDGPIQQFVLVCGFAKLCELLYE